MIDFNDMVSGDDLAVKDFDDLVQRKKTSPSNGYTDGWSDGQMDGRTGIWNIS